MEHRRKRNSFHLGSGKTFLENVALEMAKEMGEILVESYVRKGIEKLILNSIKDAKDPKYP